MRPLLVLQHVPCEGPHRIAEAFGPDMPVKIVAPLVGDPLPAVGDVAGAVLMGGPMNVDDTARHPALADERRWVERALEDELPLLGVCLGSQLIARALGAAVEPGPRPEIGWAEVEVLVPDDPLVGPLAPVSQVLHWHGDRFDTPPGATLLARSAQTPCQAFRHGRAWGLLFHPEADSALVERWLAEPAMASEAAAALGDQGVEAMVADAARHEDDLTRRSTPGFRHFARLVEARAAENA